MGAACFKQYPEDHLQAEKEIQAGKKQRQREIKLLLLGAGDSGKSTIAKQMKIIHKQHWTPDEVVFDRLTYIVAAMMAIIYGAAKYNYSLSAEAQEASVILTNSFPQRSPRDVSLLDEAHVDALRLLYRDRSVQEIIRQYSTKLQLSSSTEYFLSAIDRVFQQNYIPAEQDILRARRPTTGIHIIEFQHKDVNFKCVDVGGQRTERRKWLHVFDDVTSVIFCVALDEYDLRMFEDENVWRVHESLQLFNEIANSTHLAGAAIVLFLNKKDLFERKIREIDLSITFPEYAGGKDFNKASEFYLADEAKGSSVYSPDVRD